MAPQLSGPAAARPRPFRMRRPRSCAAPQLHGPGGLGCAASGIAEKGTASISSVATSLRRAIFAPRLRSPPSMGQTCNPYTTLGAKGPKIATATALVPNIVTLTRVLGARRGGSKFATPTTLREKHLNPSNTLGAWGLKIATPTARWGPEGPNLQPLQRFGGSGPETCNPYNTLALLRLKVASPTPLWGHGGRKFHAPPHFGAPVA